LQCGQKILLTVGSTIIILENIEVTDDGYKLLTSKTDKPLECPDNDIICQRISPEEVEITFVKKMLVTKS
jgi:hypothetical protein